MKTRTIIVGLMISVASFAHAADRLKSDFVESPVAYHSRSLWFWNGRLDTNKTVRMVNACKEAGYYGMGILPTGEMGVGFMSPEFLLHYRTAVEAAAKNGMKMCLYDEYWFPSGSAGGLLAHRFPEALSKRLDMQASDVQGPKEFSQSLPQGTFMGAVAMDIATLKRENISTSVKEGKLVWNVPAGNWKIMVFTCVRDGGAGLVNYLSPEAVQKFIEITYEGYFNAMPGHFGTTIDSAFYDEPAMYHVQGGRAWTDDFNVKFQKKFGYDPVPLYPALWMEIGADTASARNALFGMRAELYSVGFPKTINDWCVAHKIQLTGHVDQEEVVNPVIGLTGDLMKSFKYQDMPGIDEIGSYGRASKPYKIVSSSAFNYDHPLVMTECYGAMNNMPVAVLYKEAMDQFAKGINKMVPHAVWYNSPHVSFPPDLTPGAATYGPELLAYNQYIGRLQRLLQGGRHVADIAVLYPIATLQAGSWFGPGDPYHGCVPIPEADYMDVGERLSTQVRRDFTFLHPEVLETKCKVKANELRLLNKINYESYKVFIIPGSRAINIGSLRKAKDFFEHGGMILATTRLPELAAEAGKDGEVRQLVMEIFGDKPMKGKQNKRGGRSRFLPDPSAAALQAVLDEFLPVGDVVWEETPVTSGGNLSYIHKVQDGRDVYFFGNSSNHQIEMHVQLRGKHQLEAWDPHNGNVTPVEAKPQKMNGNEWITKVRWQLEAVHSVFLVEKK